MLLNGVRLASALAMVAVGVSGASSDLPTNWVVEDGPFVTVEDGRFIDQDGRQVILRGVNVGEKRSPYLSWHGPREYAQMRGWGFNCIRLLTFWAAIEPECGRYDEEYLKGLDERIKWAKENNIYVILDMHQDLYGEGIPGGDGAPKWATLDEGKRHASLGFVWSDAYLVSPKIHAAFDNFWNNSPGPDGVGIQDRFALAWQHLARRYADEPAVIGFDLLNEPFPGSDVLDAVIATFPVLRQVLTPDSLSGKSIMEKLSDMSTYKAILDAAGGVCQTFEREKLTPMFQRVGEAIRKVDRRHILFIAPCVFTNPGIPSALEPVLGEDGQVDPHQAFAPHAYDITVDSPNPEDANSSRLSLIFERHAETARRLGMPFVVGEWGAFYGSPNVIPVARAYAHEFEKYLAGDTYWDFHEGFERTAFFPMLERPYPHAVSGKIVQYQYDSEKETFKCSWDESGNETKPSIFFFPGERFPTDSKIELIPPSLQANMAPVFTHHESKNWFLNIVPFGQTCRRELVITASPKP